MGKEQKQNKIPADWVAIKPRTDEEACTKKPIKAGIVVSISGRKASLCLFNWINLKLHALSNDNKVKFSLTSQQENVALKYFIPSIRSKGRKTAINGKKQHKREEENTTLNCESPWHLFIISLVNEECHYGKDGVLLLKYAGLGVFWRMHMQSLCG